jgi:hypothetical protein
MAERSISPEQLKRLHTLWAMLCRHAHIDPQDRDARLGWFTGAVGRPVTSSKQLTRDEATGLITEIQKHLPPELLTRRRPDRRTARSYGTAGRRKQGAGSREQEKTIDLIDAPTWKLLGKLLADLGWDRARLDAFVISPHGPQRLATLADANKVIWALKQMVRRKSKIENRKSAAGIQSAAEVSP